METNHGEDYERFLRHFNRATDTSKKTTTKLKNKNGGKHIEKQNSIIALKIHRVKSLTQNT